MHELMFIHDTPSGRRGRPAAGLPCRTAEREARAAG